MPPIPGGSTMRRKTLSDITNVAAGDRETPRPVSFSITHQDCIDQLIKENAALLRLLEERNKIIESGGVELQKLRLALQKAHQQNWHLAQANSHMLAELHLGKDRLKALQHELGCAAAALRAKKSQLEEEKKLHKHPENKISVEAEERISKPIHLVPDESHPANHEKYRNLCKKRMLRSLSLGSSVSARKSNEKGKDNLRRRRSVTRRSDNVEVEQSDPAEDLFEIEDLRLPIRSMRVANVHKDNSGEMDIYTCSGSPVLDVVVNPVKKEAREEGCSTKKLIQGRPRPRAAEKFTL